MRKYSVYKHKNILNGKIYIGMTNNTKRRWRYNGVEYKPHKTENINRPFWNAIKKYGWENSESIILEGNLTFDEAIKSEKKYIKEYNSTDRSIGYNISSGGNGGLIYRTHPRGMKGKKQTRYQRENHKKWASNKKNNCMTNGSVVWGKTHPHPRGMTGKTHSEEFKERLRGLTGELSTNKRGVRATFPSGETRVFHTVSDCSKFLGFTDTSPTIRRLLKTGKPYKMSPQNRFRVDHHKALEGLKLEYISDNTEVTDTIKKVPAP